MDRSKDKKVLVILGPTASGKSDLGVRLARKFKGEIISADSRQVYKGLNVGSGKITKREMKGVRHHLLDVLEPHKRFSVAQYLELAENSLQNIVRNSKLPIVVGGTGFYIDALAGKVILQEVPPNPKLRSKLSSQSNAVLFKMLRRKDSRRAKSIDPQNKVRLIRALEIVAALGQVPPVRHSMSHRKFIWIGLRPDELDQRIEKRLVKRIPGMIREGRELHKKGLTYKRMNELGFEYRYTSLYLQGKISSTQMIENIKVESRRYAKRQMSWFKRNKKIKWFKPEESKQIEKYVRAMLG